MNVIVQPLDGLDADQLLELSDRYKQKHAPAAVVLGSKEDGKVHLVANFDDAVAEQVSASDVVREAAAIVGGGGGGRPTMARAGGQGSREAPGRARRGRAPHRRVVVRVLALDYGAARTGVAVSDATGTIARPLGVVERAASEAGLAEVRALVRGARCRARDRRHAADAARRARRPGGRDRCVRRGSAGDGRRAGRDVRRALHDGARGTRTAATPTRTRARRRISWRATCSGRAREAPDRRVALRRARVRARRLHGRRARRRRPSRRHRRS